MSPADEQRISALEAEVSRLGDLVEELLPLRNLQVEGGAGGNVISAKDNVIIQLNS